MVFHVLVALSRQAFSYCKNNAGPAVEGCFDPVVTLASVGPIEGLNQLQAAEIDPSVGKIAFSFGQLDQCKDDFIINRRGKAAIACLYRQLASQRKARLPVVNLILVNSFFLVFGHPVRQKRDGETRQDSFHRGPTPWDPNP